MFPAHTGTHALPLHTHNTLRLADMSFRVCAMEKELALMKTGSSSLMGQVSLIQDILVEALGHLCLVSVKAFLTLGTHVPGQSHICTVLLPIKRLARLYTPTANHHVNTYSVFPLWETRRPWQEKGQRGLQILTFLYPKLNTSWKKNFFF